MDNCFILNLAMAARYGSVETDGLEANSPRPESPKVKRNSYVRIFTGVLTFAIIVVLAVVNYSGGLFLSTSPNTAESKQSSFEEMVTQEKVDEVVQGIVIDSTNADALPVLPPSSAFEDTAWYHTSKPTKSPDYVKKTLSPTTPSAQPTHSPDFGIDKSLLTKSPDATKKPTAKPTMDPDVERTSKPTKSPSTTKSPLSTKKPTFKPTKSPSYTNHPTKPTSEDATKSPNHTRRPTNKPTKSPDYVKASVKPTVHSHNQTDNNDDVLSADDDDNFV